MVKKILFLLFSLLIISGCQVADLQEAPIQVSETPPADLINTVQPIDENQASEVESP
ncbi:MAG: putative lipoprotein YajG, partial [Cellvibrionaceae bacterium]